MMYRNPLLQRMTRHANMAILFPTTAVSPRARLPLPTVAAQPSQKLQMQQMPNEPEARDSQLVSPPTSVQRQPAPAVEPASTLPAATPAAAESTEAEDRNWTRLQNIVRLHEEQQQVSAPEPIPTTPESGTVVQKTAVSPSPSSSIAAPSQPNTAASPQPLPVEAEPEPQQPSPAASASTAPLSAAQPVQRQAADQPISPPSSLGTHAVATTPPELATPLAADTAQTEATEAAAVPKVTPPQTLPVARESVAEPVVQSIPTRAMPQADRPIQRQPEPPAVPKPAAVGGMVAEETLASEGEAALHQAETAVVNTTTEPAIQREAAKPARVVAPSVPPLEAVWPVEQTEQAKADLPMVAPARPVPSPQMVQQLSEEKERVQARLAHVEAERPTESAIDLILPRRPHPTQLQRKTAVVHTPTLAQSKSDPSPQPTVVAEQVSSLPTTTASASLPVPPLSATPLPVTSLPATPTSVASNEPQISNQPQMPTAAPPVEKTVSTSVGELPEDLWALLGEETPTTTSSATVQRREEEAVTPKSELVAQPAAKPQLVDPPPPMPMPIVQRAPEDVEAAVVSEEETAVSETNDDEETDLDDLAQRVFRQLKRRLTVEYERMRRQR